MRGTGKVPFWRFFEADLPKPLTGRSRRPRPTVCSHCGPLLEPPLKKESERAPRTYFCKFLQV